MTIKTFLMQKLLFFNPKIKKVTVKKGEFKVYNFINNDAKNCLAALITANAAG